MRRRWRNGNSTTSRRFTIALHLRGRRCRRRMDIGVDAGSIWWTTFIVCRLVTWIRTMRRTVLRRPAFIDDWIPCRIDRWLRPAFARREGMACYPNRQQPFTVSSTPPFMFLAPPYLSRAPVLFRDVESLRVCVKGGRGAGMSVSALPRLFLLGKKTGWAWSICWGMEGGRWRKGWMDG